MKKIILFPFFFIVFTSLAQTRLTIQSSDEKCATVFTSNRDFAAGDQGFWAARLNSGKNGSFITIRSFLEFDLSSIPVGSFVNWARLTLYSIGDGGPDNGLLRRVTSPWDPATVTWNTQPGTTKRGTIRLPRSTSGNEVYKNINVTNLVQIMVDSPANSFGFALRVDSDAGENIPRTLFFISPAFDEPHKNPKLVMEYTAPGMQPAVTTMSVDLSDASTEMTLYPNPCNGIFNCNLQSTEPGYMHLKVIDILGRPVYSQSVNTSSRRQLQVNLPPVSAGTYFVILQDYKGTIVSQELHVR